MHTWPHRDAHICVLQCQGFRADMGSQVDMHICMETCTPSNQGTVPNEG